MFKKVDSVFDETYPPGLCLQYNGMNLWGLVVQKGEALEVHVKATDRKGKLNTRKAMMEFIKLVPEKWPDCPMIIAKITKRSVLNLCVKLNFADCGKANYNGVNYRLMAYKIKGE